MRISQAAQLLLYWQRACYLYKFNTRYLHTEKIRNGHLSLYSGSNRW